MKHLLLKFKFSHFLWIIVVGMLAMIISFISFMSLIYVSTKENEKLTINGRDFIAYGVNVSRASDYLTNQARLYSMTGNKLYYDNYWNEVNNVQRRDKAIVALKELGVPNDILSLVELAKKDSDALVKIEEQSFEAVAKGDLLTAAKLMSSQEYQIGKDKIQVSLNKFEDMIKAYSDKILKEANSNITNTIILSVLSISSVAVIFLVFLFFFIKVIQNTLYTIDKLFLSIANGDMTVKAPSLVGQAEIVTTFNNINLSLSSITEILKNVTEATEEVASSNDQLASTMEELSSTFAEQAHQVSDTAVSLDSINSTVRDTVDSLKSNQDIVDSTVMSANDGKKQLTDLKISMEKIHSDADSLSDTITNLANSSSEIGNIVTVINDIADQTNLLALNAAIEAARAGDAGRGFAVVADEVRKLAERTQKATSEVTNIVSALQQEALTASSAMGMEAERVKEGVINIEKTEDVFNKIFDGIDGIKGIMSTIREDMNNEYSTVQTVHETSMNIATGIEESSNAVNEITQTIEHLQNRVSNIKMMLSKFKFS